MKPCSGQKITMNTFKCAIKHHKKLSDKNMYKIIISVVEILVPYSVRREDQSTYLGKQSTILRTSLSLKEKTTERVVTQKSIPNIPRHQKLLTSVLFVTDVNFFVVFDSHGVVGLGLRLLHLLFLHFL